MSLSESIELLLKSLCPMFYLGSFSGKSTVRKCIEAGSRNKMEVFCYSLTDGIRRPNEERDAKAPTDPMEMLEKISSMAGQSVLAKRRLFVLKHFDLLMGNGDPMILTSLRTINERAARGLSVVLTGRPFFPLPGILADLPRIDAPFPEETDVERMLLQCRDDSDEDTRKDLAAAIRGLTELECENLLSLCLAAKGGLDKAFMEKERAAILCRRGGGMVELIRPAARWEELGGLELLKTWLARRGKFLKASNGPLARVPSPKGVLVTGPPGCGKSFLSHALADAWKVNLVKLHAARHFSSLVGETEKNVEMALQTVVSLAPCILWIDEFEKFFPRGLGQASDGGVSSRVLGLFLDFLHSQREGVFVCATANNIALLPEEITRAGRFDAVFFVDLPTRRERREIFEIVLAKYGADLHLEEKSALLAASEGFSGAEIEQAVVEALYEVADHGKPLDEFTLMRNVGSVAPLSRMLGGRLEEMRDWGRAWARPASVCEKGG
jgi:hypothetical protein